MGLDVDGFNINHLADFGLQVVKQRHWGVNDASLPPSN